MAYAHRCVYNRQRFTGGVGRRYRLGRDVAQSFRKGYDAGGVG